MNQEFDEFGAIMAGLALNLQAKPPAKALLDMWFEAFKADGYSMGQVRQAANAIFRNRVYTKMPPYAVFVAEIVGEKKEIENRMAMMAWEKLIYHLRSSGANVCRRKKVAFEDPKINFAVRMLGGWDVLKNLKDKDHPWRKKDFTEFYLAALADETIMIGHKPSPEVKGLIGGIGQSIPSLDVIPGVTNLK